MASTLKHLRSSTADKRPTASGLADGQLAINTASGTPALFFKDSNGGVVKVGPAHVGSAAPNAVPAGSAGNSLGELWVDNSLTTPGLNYYTGSAFVNLTPSGTTTTVGLVELATPAETQAGTDAIRAVTPSGLQSKVSDSTSTTSSTTIASSTAVKSAYDLANAALPKAGGTITGGLLIGNTGSLVFEGSTDDSFETTIAVVDPTADRTITFPNVTGTVITTGDTGTVTSTMILDGTITGTDVASGTITSTNIADNTIVNADINSAAAITYSKLALSSGIVNTDISASAAIAGTKISPDFGSQNILTTGTITGGSFIPTSSGVPTNGLYLPAANTVAISTNGDGRLFIDSTGRVGVGTSAPSERLHLIGSTASPSSGTAYNILRLVGNSGTPANAGGLTIGAYWNNTDVNGRTAYIQSSQGLDAGSTARNLLLNPSGGSVGIGTTSPSGALHINANTDATTLPSIILQDSGTTATRLSSITNTNGDLCLAATASLTDLRSFIYLQDDRQIVFGQSNTERARIDTSGRLLVGTSSSLADSDNLTANLQVVKASGTATEQGVASFSLYPGTTADRRPIVSFNRSRGTTSGTYTVVASGDNLGSIYFNGADGSKFVNAAAIGAAVDGTPGANDMPGRLVFSTTADGASSPTERMRIDSDGALCVAKTAANRATAGYYFHPSGYSQRSTLNDVIDVLNRQSSDGTLVEFRQSDTAEGTISVSGTTVSYNGAHLSRWSQIPGIEPHDKDQRPEILRGTVMSNLDEMCDWIEPESGDAQDNEQLNKTKISDVEGDKNVAGVFQAWDDDDDTWVNDYYLAMTGDFVIRIAEGVPVERGDLLMSAGDGTAKPQDDDIIRSKTIAKVTSTNVSCTYEDGSYCVPCVLMAC